MLTFPPDSNCISSSRVKKKMPSPILVKEATLRIQVRETQANLINLERTASRILAYSAALSNLRRIDFARPG